MKIELMQQQGVLATENDLAMLRTYAETLQANPTQHIEIVKCHSNVKNRYIFQTLLHFGASCGQIRLVAN